MINERLSELGGAIINIVDNKYHVTGFMFPERLEDYIYRNINCFFSKGVYPLAPIDYSVLQNDAIVILTDESGVKKKTCFTLIKKESVKYKTPDNKDAFKVYSIRQCKYSAVYNLKFSDESLLFDTFEELNEEFFNRFNSYIEIEEQLSLF